MTSNDDWTTVLRRLLNGPAIAAAMTAGAGSQIMFWAVDMPWAKLVVAGPGLLLLELQGYLLGNPVGALTGFMGWNPASVLILGTLLVSLPIWMGVGYASVLLVQYGVPALRRRRTR